jgi:hypothetical protein
MKNKKLNVEFCCNKCNKKQNMDDKMSNENWGVYKTNEKCECGGSFKMKVNGEFLNN